MVKLMCFWTFSLWLFRPILSSDHFFTKNNHDVKLLETWWIWHILGEGTHIYSNQKQKMAKFCPCSCWMPLIISNLFYRKDCEKISLLMKLNFMFSEKATKIDEIFTIDWHYVSNVSNPRWRFRQILWSS